MSSGVRLDPENSIARRHFQLHGISPDPFRMQADKIAIPPILALSAPDISCSRLNMYVRVFYKRPLQKCLYTGYFIPT